MQRHGHLQAALIVLLLLGAGQIARAEEPEEPNPLSLGPAGSAGSAETSRTAETSTLTAVEVHERRDAPFDPDSELRLSGRQLRQLGITDLAEALDLLPGVVVRGGGRGGLQADIRGAKKGSVMVLIDGMPIQEPYFGNFDLSSIPTTDIAEIRISQAPASPLDGPGGPGGVVEVITRAPGGKPEAILRAEVGDSPGGRGSATLRTTLPGDVAIRVSGGGTIDNRPISDPSGTQRLDTRSGHGALLAERVTPGGRLGADLWASRGHSFVPENPNNGMLFADLLVDREDSFRGAIHGELRAGQLKLGARAYAQLLERAQRGYAKSLLDTPVEDDVRAHRYGASLQASLPILPELELQGAAHLVAEDGTETVGSIPPLASSSLVGEAALGARWRPYAFLSIDGAAGAADPLGVSGLSSPWPEARLALTLSSTLAQLRLTGARKGRIPTLRELYSVAESAGNVAPEMSSYAEAQLVLRPFPWLAATFDVFYKTIEGLIRIDPATRRFGNVGDVAIPGADARLDLDPEGAVSAGVAYSFGDPRSAFLGANPLDFFPRHRLDAWAAARYGTLAGAWARVRYESERWDSQGTARLPGYTTLDATLWLHYEKLRLLLRAQNLLDQRYLARASIPGWGRTLLLGIEAVID